MSFKCHLCNPLVDSFCGKFWSQKKCLSGSKIPNQSSSKASFMAVYPDFILRYSQWSSNMAMELPSYPCLIAEGYIVHIFSYIISPYFCGLDQHF